MLERSCCGLIIGKWIALVFLNEGRLLQHHHHRSHCHRNCCVQHIIKGSARCSFSSNNVNAINAGSLTFSICSTQGCHLLRIIIKSRSVRSAQSDCCFLQTVSNCPALQTARAGSSNYFYIIIRTSLIFLLTLDDFWVPFKWHGHSPSPPSTVLSH